MIKTYFPGGGKNVPGGQGVHGRIFSEMTYSI